VPSPFNTPEENEECFSQFEAWLDEHSDIIACILVEPQWGSTAAAYPWPKDLLKRYISLAHKRGILVIADEIMCGLSRHGQGSCFVTEAWELDVDAVTFGKAIGAGVFPISGCLIRRGAKTLGLVGKTVMQSHTYSGSSIRSLMTATEVLKLLKNPEITKTVT